MSLLNEDNIAALSTPEKVLEQIQLSNVALEKAAAAEAQYKQASDNAKMAIPTVVEALVVNGCIQPTQREKAANVLLSHAEALKLLAKVAAFKGNTPAALGSPVEKTAAAADDEMSEADRRFLERLSS